MLGGVPDPAADQREDRRTDEGGAPPAGDGDADGEEKEEPGQRGDDDLEAAGHARLDVL